MDAQQDVTWVSYLVPALIIAVVLALRWRRMSRVRPLKLERLWIFPAFYAVVAVAMYARFPPQGWGWAFCALALAAGAALGWQRGKLMRITVDPETHALNQSASPAAMLFILALIATRFGARSVLSGGGGALHLNAMAITDILIALGLGLFTVQRIEMYLRAKRLLEAAARCGAGRRRAQSVTAGAERAMPRRRTCSRHTMYSPLATISGAPAHVAAIGSTPNSSQP